MTGPSLAEQQSWLQAAFDLLPLPVLLIEPETGRVLFANRSAGRFPLALATPGDDGQGPTEAFDEVGAPLPPDRWPHRRAASGEALDGVQVTWRSARGRASFMVFSGTFPAMHGHRPVVVLTFVDVTRLKATEEELRTAVQVRDEFLSVATHELRDPLASLLLSVEVLKRVAARRGGVPVETLIQQLEISQRQGERLGRMIENLLDVTRIANRRLRLDLEALDLCEVVREVVARSQEQAISCGSTLTLEPCDPVIAYLDRMKVEQVVTNLVSNALKYGAGKPVSVRLRADPGAAFIEVEDHGIGIAPADHARVFERFERATDGHRERSLGLGLYIVRSIAEAHGGSVALSSEPGRGSTFTVELPRKRLPDRGEAEDGRSGY